MAAKPRPHVARALAYAKAVVAGKVPACKWVRMACQRHLDDLAASRRKGARWVFDAGKAEAICTFAELLPHVKGHWAIPKPGDPTSTLIRLEDWDCFFLAVVFGWLERSTKHRRFRVAYLEVPRKNGKSVLAAIVGLYGLAADGEFGAEIYSGAGSEKQAWEVFRPAKQMAERTPTFLAHYGVQVNAKGLVILANGSRFEPIIGKPGDGASPSIAIIDEYHEHPDATLYDTMLTGMGARQQPLALVITTAGSNIGGPCYALRQQMQAMLSGTQPDDRLFALMYGLDDGDNWATEAALRKANPNYGVSVSAVFLKDKQREAVSHARHQTPFKTKHLNVWVTARDAWMNSEWWSRQADRELDPAAFVGEPCFVGVDLASRVDLASTCRVYRRQLEDEVHFYAFWRTYAPRSTVDDPKNQHYQGWAEDGWLVATEGEDQDYDRIASDLVADVGGSLAAVAVDPWNSRALTDLLRLAGVSPEQIIEVPQQVAHLSGPMKDIEAAVKAGRFHHVGDPCATWQIGNVTVREDPNDNIFPRKDRRENKIDAALALILAMTRAVIGGDSGSIYDTRGPVALG